MKTEVTMKRPLFGHEIRQKSQSEFLCATDLARAGNHWRALNDMTRFDMDQWLKLRGTEEFIVELEKEFGSPVVQKTGRGRNAGTWMHPLLFIDMALTISPKLKLEAYKWLYDQLLKYRNESGDSYKLMSGALYSRIGRKADFQRYIQSVAAIIKRECGVTDWQKADEQQLQLRDKIQSNIALLASVVTDPDTAVAYGIKEALK